MIGAVLRPIDTGYDFDQRALATTVLPREAMHLAWQNVELDIFERPHAAERHIDVLEGQQGLEASRLSLVRHDVVSIGATAGRMEAARNSLGSYIERAAWPAALFWLRRLQTPFRRGRQPFPC